MTRTSLPARSPLAPSLDAATRGPLRARRKRPSLGGALAALGLALTAGAAAAQKPPSQEAIVAYETRMRAENAFLSRCNWQIDTSAAPLLFFTQEPMGGAEAIHAGAKELYLPWLAQLTRTTLGSYIVPLGLQRAADPAFTSVFVLQDGRTFATTKRGARVSGHPDEPYSVALEPLSMVLAYMRAHTGSLTAADMRVPVLRTYFKELVREHAPDGRAPRESWLLDGLATWHSYHEGDDPGQLGSGLLPMESIHFLQSCDGDDVRWKSMMLPMYEMRAMRSDKDLLRAFRTQARNAGGPMQGQQECKEAFRLLSDLRVAFMMSGEGGRFQAAVVPYLGKTLADAGSDEELEKALDTSLSYFDEKFEDWARGVARGEYVVAGTSEASFSMPGYVTPAVAVVPETGREWIGASLGLATTGDFEGARAMLQGALGSVSDAKEQERIQREAERLDAWIAARDGFLEALAGDSKGRFRLKTDEGRIVAPVEGVEDGVIKLGENRVGVREVALRSVTPEQWLEVIDKDLKDHGPKWLEPYAQLLAGEKRWDKSLDDEEPGGAALKKDAADLLALLEEAPIIGRLDAIAKLPAPDSLDAARAIIDATRALQKEYANEKLVRERADALTQLCQRAFGLMYDAEGLSSQLAGKIESLEGGKTRISYTFDSAEELNDWSQDVGYLAERRAKKFPVEKTEQQSSWSVKAGNLEGDGQVCLRHALEWQSPMKISYQILYGRPQPGQGMLAHIIMGMCDDRQGSWTGGLDAYDLETHEKSLAKVLAEVERSNREIKAAKAYKMSLVHDGNSLTLYRDGEKLRTIGIENRTAGGVFLFVHSTLTVAIKGITIEGTIQKGEDDPAKARWVKKELADMGLYL